MDADGTKEGFDNQLNREISKVVEIPIIASGGAGTKEHIKDAFVEGEADAALGRSIFHFREIEILDLKHYLRDNSIPVRI